MYPGVTGKPIKGRLINYFIVSFYMLRKLVRSNPTVKHSQRWGLSQRQVMPFPRSRRWAGTLERLSWTCSRRGVDAISLDFPCRKIHSPFS